MSLREDVKELVRSAAVGDADQRSALGMARRWMDKPESLVRSEHELMKGRDDLAFGLVALLEGEPRREGIKALTAAREMVNETFRDPSMLGFQAARAKAGMVGSEKKNEKAGSK